MRNRLRILLLLLPLGIPFSLPAVVLAAKVAQGVRLVPKGGDDRIHRVEAKIEIAGSLKVADQKNSDPIKMTVAGNLTYDERRIASGSKNTERSLRYYDHAAIEIKVGDHLEKPTLRDDRRLIGLDATGDEPELFSPSGYLTREELDLIDLPGTSVVCDGLLPTKSCKPGSTWEPSQRTLAQLVRIDNVSKSTVLCKLESLENQAAKIEFTGDIEGAIGGVSTEISLKGKITFDLAHERIRWLAVLIKENRAIGHASPGLSATTKIQMAVKDSSGCPYLTDDAIAGVPQNAQEAPLNLSYEFSDHQVRLLHDRRWILMNDTRDLAALRFIDQGELVAQCNLFKRPQIDLNDIPTLEKFQDEVKKALGENFREFAGANQTTNAQGHLVIQVTAIGEVSELPMEWRYFYVANDQGEQIAAVFTLEPSFSERLAAEDETMMNSVEFLSVTDTALLNKR